MLLHASMAQLGIEAWGHWPHLQCRDAGDTLSAAFSLRWSRDRLSDVIGTDGVGMAIGQTLDEAPVLDEMFTENAWIAPAASRMAITIRVS